MLTSSVNVIIQLLILYACKILLLIDHTHNNSCLCDKEGDNIIPIYTGFSIYTVTGLPLTTLLHLSSPYTHYLNEQVKNFYIAALRFIERSESYK